MSAEYKVENESNINIDSGRSIDVINNHEAHNNSKGGNGTEELMLEEVEYVEQLIEYVQNDDAVANFVMNIDEPTKLQVEHVNPLSDVTVETIIKNAYEESYNKYEGPTSSSRAKLRALKKDVIKEQCRICMAKESLISLFEIFEQHHAATTIAELLMMICPTVSIAVKDYMPQFVCASCLNKIFVAVELKQQCESTERELRKKLSRHKHKVRRPTGFVTVDATLDSDPPSEEHYDDEDFKISENSVSVEDTNDSVFSGDLESSRDSTFGGRKIQNPIARRGRPRKYPLPENGAKYISSVHAGNNRKRKRTSTSYDSNGLYPTDECSPSFNDKLSLEMHQKTHSYDRNQPMKCHICGREFKIQRAYQTHMQKHESGPLIYKCQKCQKSLPIDKELKQHVFISHNQKEAMYHCEKCKRSFDNYPRFTQHQKRCQRKNKQSSIEEYVLEILMQVNIENGSNQTRLHIPTYISYENTPYNHLSPWNCHVVLTHQTVYNTHIYIILINILLLLFIN